MNQQSWDSTWEDIFQKRDWGNWPSEDVVRAVCTEFSGKDKSKIKILEVGCGTGANLWFLTREGYQVYGVDGSETAVKKAIQRLDTTSPNWKGQILVADIANLPFDNNTFDMIIDCEALSANSYDNSLKLHKEIARVLKPGGKFYSRTFAKGTWGDRPNFREGTIDQGPLSGLGMMRLTSRDEIEELLGTAFKVENVDLLTRSIGGDLENKVIREWMIKAVKE